eukprot:6119663-Prymnesium_polylepis.1
MNEREFEKHPRSGANLHRSARISRELERIWWNIDSRVKRCGAAQRSHLPLIQQWALRCSSLAHMQRQTASIGDDPAHKNLDVPVSGLSLVDRTGTLYV